ncbi:MAG: FmdB family transcriptional regulator [Desulfobacteraceae bacterium IS3]|nr:MAG: FmdB family transcriptional regulator [Desulfobacteraceae bacterium IS3]
MPLFDYLCTECGKISEILITGSEDSTQCRTCGSRNLKKMLSAHSSLSGTSKNSMPGHGDTACCGSAPGQRDGCAGPGSCCGRG